MIRSLLSRISGEPTIRANSDTRRRDRRRTPRVEGLEDRKLLNGSWVGLNGPNNYGNGGSLTFNHGISGLTGGVRP